MTNKPVSIDSIEQNLFDDIVVLIEQSKKQVAVQANSTVTLLFWNVGHRINEFVLQNKRAEYGKQIVITLSSHLVTRYGNSFEERNLRRMIQFTQQFPEIKIVATVSSQLSWSHFIELFALKKEEEKPFM